MKIKRAPKRDPNAELQSMLADAKAGTWARKTEFTRRSDGGWRRRVVRADGTVEKDERSKFGHLLAMVSGERETKK